jgi:hypothetical protein
MVKRSRGRSSFVVPGQTRLGQRQVGTNGFSLCTGGPEAPGFQKYAEPECEPADSGGGVKPFSAPSCSVTRCVWLPEVQSEAQRHAVSWLGLAGRPVNSQTSRHNREPPCSAEPAVRRLGPADRPVIVEPVATPRACILCTRGRKAEALLKHQTSPDLVDLQVDRPGRTTLPVHRQLVLDVGRSS